MHQHSRYCPPREVSSTAPQETIAPLWPTETSLPEFWKKFSTGWAPSRPQVSRMTNESRSDRPGPVITSSWQVWRLTQVRSWDNLGASREQPRTTWELAGSSPEQPGS